MKLVTLSPWALTALYFKHLCRDFPPAERRPLPSMLNLRRRGLYQAYAMKDRGGETAGYAAVAAGKNGALLLDYLAVCAGRRGGGEGSILVSLLDKRLAKAPLFAEVEDPDATKDPNERKIRLRRIRFYLKNGFCDTGIRCRVFGVRYQILALHPHGDAKKALDAIYRTLFPKMIYEKQIQYL